MREEEGDVMVSSINYCNYCNLLLLSAIKLDSTPEHPVFCLGLQAF